MDVGDEDEDNDATDEEDEDASDEECWSGMEIETSDSEETESSSEADSEDASPGMEIQTSESEDTSTESETESGDSTEVEKERVPAKQKIVKEELTSEKPKGQAVMLKSSAQNVKEPEQDELDRKKTKTDSSKQKGQSTSVGTLPNPKVDGSKPSASPAKVTQVSPGKKQKEQKKQVEKVDTKHKTSAIITEDTQAPSADAHPEKSPETLSEKKRKASLKKGKGGKCLTAAALSEGSPVMQEAGVKTTSAKLQASTNVPNETKVLSSGATAETTRESPGKIQDPPSKKRKTSLKKGKGDKNANASEASPVSQTAAVEADDTSSQMAGATLQREKTTGKQDSLKRKKTGKKSKEDKHEGQDTVVSPAHSGEMLQEISAGDKSVKTASLHKKKTKEKKDKSALTPEKTGDDKIEDVAKTSSEEPAVGIPHTDQNRKTSTKKKKATKPGSTEGVTKLACKSVENTTSEVQPVEIQEADTEKTSTLPGVRDKSLKKKKKKENKAPSDPLVGQDVSSQKLVHHPAELPVTDGDERVLNTNPKTTMKGMKKKKDKSEKADVLASPTSTSVSSEVPQREEEVDHDLPKKNLKEQKRNRKAKPEATESPAKSLHHSPSDASHEPQETSLTLIVPAEAEVLPPQIEHQETLSTGPVSIHKPKHSKRKTGTKELDNTGQPREIVLNHQEVDMAPKDLGPEEDSRLAVTLTLDANNNLPHIQPDSTMITSNRSSPANERVLLVSETDCTEIKVDVPRHVYTAEDIIKQQTNNDNQQDVVQPNAVREPDSQVTRQLVEAERWSDTEPAENQRKQSNSIDTVDSEEIPFMDYEEHLIEKGDIDSACEKTPYLVLDSGALSMIFCLFFITECFDSDIS